MFSTNPKYLINKIYVKTNFTKAPYDDQCNDQFKVPTMLQKQTLHGKVMRLRFDCIFMTKNFFQKFQV